MKALQLTFENGDTVQFPFGPDSQLTVDTPDGVNGVKRGSWGEIADLAVVDVADTTPAETPAAPPTDTPPVGDQTGAATASAGHADAPVVTDGATSDSPVVSATPAEAVANAQVLPVADALAHIDAALAKWPGDPDLLSAQADLQASPPAA